MSSLITVVFSYCRLRIAKIGLKRNFSTFGRHQKFSLRMLRQMFLWMFLHIFLRKFEKFCLYLSLYECMSVSTYLHLYERNSIHTFIFLYVCEYICMYLCMQNFAYWPRSLQIALTLIVSTSISNRFVSRVSYWPPAKSPIYGLEWRILHENSCRFNFQTIYLCFDSMKQTNTDIHTYIDIHIDI